MIAHERRSRILALVEKNRRVGFAGLVRAIGVSPATLRRDLELLEGGDLLVRVHGAVLHPSEAVREPSLVEKSRMKSGAKRRIGTAAAALVPDGAWVFVDSGTTCLEAARSLRDRSDLTIVTNSLAVAAGHEFFKARLVVTGGERRAVSGALTGRLAEEALSEMRADIALIGASGLDAKAGPGTTEEGERAIKARWIASARRAVLLCDSSKWSSAAAFVFANWPEFSDFITDRPPPPDFPSKKPKIHIV